MNDNKSRLPPAGGGRWGWTMAMLLGLTLSARAETWTLLSREAALEEPGLSEMGRSLAKGKSWVHMEAGPLVVGHADHEEALQEALTQTAFFAARLDQWALGAATNRRIHLFIVVDGRNWQRQLHTVDGRQDALAAQYQDDVYLFWDPNNVPADAVRLAHELVHQRLQTLDCRSRLPVWLEEGMAGYLGWELARAYRQSRGQELFRKLPPVSEREIISMEELAALATYPADPETARRMYRQAEEWVRQIALRIGNERLSEFVHAVCGEGMLWSEVLRTRFGYSDQDVKALEEEVREQLLGRGKS